MALQQISPIHVNFDLPEQHYERVRPGQTITLAVDAYPVVRFTGRVVAVNPLVEENARSFTVQARLPNPETQKCR